VTARAVRVALVLLLACLPAWAQEDDTPLEPGMLEECPDLKDAGPREKKQLVALFFELDPKVVDPKTRARVKSLFDLKLERDLAILERYLDAEGKISCLPGLQTVFRAHQDDGLLWLLERYASAEIARRGRLVEVLAAFEGREVWRLMVELLDDRKTVPNPQAAQIAPPGYVDLRVCDYALRALARRLRDVKAVDPPGDQTQRKVHATTPVEIRNVRAGKLAAFLATDEAFHTHLMTQPSLLDGPQAERARAVCEELGLSVR